MLVLLPDVSLIPDVSPYPCVTYNFVTNVQFTDRHTCAYLLLDTENIFTVLPSILKLLIY